MKRALVFSGQGTHGKGMCLSLLDDPAVAHVWDRMTNRMTQNFGVPLQLIMQENPKRITARSDAFKVDEVCQRPCTNLLNSKESEARTHVVAHPDGVMQYTYLTQPCVLAAQLLAYEKLKSSHSGEYNKHFTCIAGHSLGEFTALAALGVFSPETAVDLTFKRGLLMEEACEGVPRGSWKMYACSPLRAKLHSDGDMADTIFLSIVESVAESLKHSSSFVEVVNSNIRHQQIVVAGDSLGLAVLGKCLDPQYRANSGATDDVGDLVRHALESVRADIRDGVASNPDTANDTDFATSSTRKYGSRAAFRRFVKGADDGYTPQLDELTHLTLEENGRSGLKKKSWFIPLNVEVPFHSSKLRLAMDKFLPVVRSALPEEVVLRDLLSISKNGALKEADRTHPLWVTNLTGNTFDPWNVSFQESVLGSMSKKNVGESRHKGRYESNFTTDTFKRGIEEGSVKEIVTAVLAAQLAHPVQWIRCMDEIVIKHGCTAIQEASPQKNTAEMFKRTSFWPTGTREVIPPLRVASFPAEKPIF